MCLSNIPKTLTETIFSDYYEEEKYSVYLDNINLLYVALTRAKDVLYCFSVDNPKSENSIAGILKNAVSTDYHEGEEFCLGKSLQLEKKIFEYGEIPENKTVTSDNKNLLTSTYSVSQTMESLKLKLHGENYFSTGKRSLKKEDQLRKTYA